MTKIDNQSSSELIATIDRSDKRFKIFQTIFMIACIAFLGVVLGYQYTILQHLQNQVRTSKNELQTSIHQIETDQDKQTKYINCIAQLFGASPNTIITQDQFNKCLDGALIIHDKNTVLIPFNMSPAPTTPAQSGTDDKTNTSSGSAQTQSTNSNTNDKNSQSNNNQGAGQIPPKEVLGVPLCIPFTARCVR